MSVIIDGSAGVTTNSGAVYNGIASGTAVASTSGTSVDFTGIPSWVKRITVMFNGVSTNGTSIMQTQIGAGSVTTTGYLGGSFQTVGAPTSSSGVYSNTTGFALSGGTSASIVIFGNLVINNISGNTWVSNGILIDLATTRSTTSGQAIALSGTLDRIRITTVNGTDTFDAGSINILYE